MRGGSAVMSNLMHRSFLFAVKVKDMMHKGVECVADSGRRCKAKDVMTSGIVYSATTRVPRMPFAFWKAGEVPAGAMVCMVSLGDLSHALARDISGED